MATSFRYGHGGSYKSACAVWFDLLPALREGRICITNIHGLGDLLVKLNDINPQNASRMLTPFMSWKRYDENRSAAMKAQLQRLADLDGLSDDLFEKVEKALES